MTTVGIRKVFRMPCRRHSAEGEGDSEVKYVVVVENDLHPMEIFGPFDDLPAARLWEDRHLDAAPGSRAHFVPLVDPVEYAGRTPE